MKPTFDYFFWETIMTIEDIKKKLTDTYNLYMNNQATLHRLMGVEKQAEKYGMSNVDIQKCYGFYFEIKDIEPLKKGITTYSKMGKGRKQCKQCNTIIAARVGVCPKCSWDFAKKKSR